VVSDNQIGGDVNIDDRDVININIHNKGDWSCTPHALRARRAGKYQRAAVDRRRRRLAAPL